MQLPIAGDGVHNHRSAEASATDVRRSRNPDDLTATITAGTRCSALAGRTGRRSGWRACSTTGPAAARFDRNALAGLAEQAAVTLRIASPGRRSRACRRGRRCDSAHNTSRRGSDTSATTGRGRGLRHLERP